jgi:FlaA1/EpsC-like NDP-sugar epimerase
LLPPTDTSRLLDTEQLACAATGRTESLFAADYQSALQSMTEQLANARVLVIGGAGSIGGSVARLLATFPTAAFHVVDSNENTLVELTRDLRSQRRGIQSRDPRWVPLDFGSRIFHRFLAEQAPYDYVLNFAAVKHVRSEKDHYSLLRMFDVNVVKQAELLQILQRRNTATRYFSVSTDKAANPVNLMGASKRMMEHVMFCGEFFGRGSATSARFANVAFSDGSLLQGWLARLAKQQPLAVPEKTRRYFVSIGEAGHLCMLAAFHQTSTQIMVPRLVDTRDLVLLDDVGRAVLERLGLKAVIYRSEAEAIDACRSDARAGRYPLLLTPLDTAGEKPYEEFVAAGEEAIEVGLRTLLAVRYLSIADPGALAAFVEKLAQWIDSPDTHFDKGQLVSMVKMLIPEFEHAESSKSLDNRV